MRRFGINYQNFVMKVQILTSGVGFGGRGKALLSLCAHLSQKFEVVVESGTLNISGDGGGGISYNDLVSHHQIFPDVEWSQQGLDEISSEGDVVIGFDSEANSLLYQFDVPTVAYCRRGISDWADEYWAPSRMAANRHNAWLRDHDLDDNCQAVYPIWYLERPNSVKSFDEREIEVLVHSRKAEGVNFSDYHVHYAEGHSWDELTEIYENSKIFLFPSKPRFEALGLMPVEAAAYGCHLSLPRNAGVSEVYPQCVYRQPERVIDELLEEDDVSDLPIPQSPTDPHNRLLRLVSGEVTA